MSTTPTPAEGALTATVQFTVEQVQALYLTLSHGRSRPDEPEKRPAYGWMEPALVEAEKILEPWHSHFHDRQFNAMNRQFFGDGRMDSSVSPAPSTPARQAPAGQALTDEQIIQRAEAAGMKWLPPDDEDEGFPGAFDLSSIDNVRRLLSTPAGQAPAPAQEPVEKALNDLAQKWDALPDKLKQHPGLKQVRIRLDVLHRALATPQPAQEPVDAGDDPFEAWWGRHGQFCRAGGGAYEKTFAYRAWQAALEVAPQPAQEPDCWAILTPNGSKLVSPQEAKGRKDAYPLYSRPQPAQEPALAQIAEQLEIMLGSAKTLGGGSIEGYQIKTGALHRVIGILVGAGHRVTVPLPSPAAHVGSPVRVTTTDAGWAQLRVAEVVVDGGYGESERERLVEMAEKVSAALATPQPAQEPEPAPAQEPADDLTIVSDAEWATLHRFVLQIEQAKAVSPPNEPRMLEREKVEVWLRWYRRTVERLESELKLCATRIHNQREEIKRLAATPQPAQEPAEDAAYPACAYRVDADTRIEEAQQMEGPSKWAIRRYGSVLGKDGQWEYEPMPSSRDDEFLARCRFDTLREAVDAARQEQQPSGGKE